MNTCRFLSLLLVAALGACLDPAEPGNLVPKTVDEDPSLPRLEVNGTVLHAETFGDPKNPMVLVLHGGPGEDYRKILPLADLAADGYFVVFWDQRGCGLSRRHPASDYGFEVVLEDLKQVIDHYGDRPFVFIGQSWGAMYATWFINTYGTYGGRIRGAVLTEPGAFTQAQLKPFIKHISGSLNPFGEDFNDITWASQIVTPEDHARADYNLTLQSAYAQPAVHQDPNNPAPHVRCGAVASATLMNLALTQGFDWTTNLAAFTPTVLFLRSELNESTTLEDQQAMASSYPSAEVVTIAGAGHEVVWEKPAAYLEQVRLYFGRIGFSGAKP